MTARHTAELQALEEAVPAAAPAEEVEDSAEIETAKLADEAERQRKQEKQRRKREKKAQAEQEREARIAEEKKSIVDLRAVEMDAFRAALQPRGMRVEPVAADGHCMFRAISARLRHEGASDLSGQVCALNPPPSVSYR